MITNELVGVAHVMSVRAARKQPGVSGQQSKKTSSRSGAYEKYCRRIASPNEHMLRPVCSYGNCDVLLMPDVF